MNQLDRPSRSRHEICWWLPVFILLVSMQGVTAQTADSLTSVSDMRWQPQGEYVLVTGRTTDGSYGLWLYDAEMQLISRNSTKNAFSIDWSPDGTRFAMGRNIIDVQTFETMVTINANSGIGGWSKDSSQVLAWADERQLGLFDTTTGNLVRTIPVGDDFPDAVSWSPDNAFLALVLPTGIARIISVDDGRVIADLPMEYPIGLRWSPDSTQIAAGFTKDVEAGTPNTLPFAADPTLASVGIWDVMSGTQIHDFSGLPEVPIRIRWNPQRPELAAASADGLIYFWNLQSGQQTNLVRTLPFLRSMEFSPFGGRLTIGSANLDLTSYPSSAQAVQPDWIRHVVPDVLQVVILQPTVELLESIQMTCTPAKEAVTVPDARSAAHRLQDYIRAIEHSDVLSNGCKAELQAIAEALTISQ